MCVTWPFRITRQDAEFTHGRDGAWRPGARVAVWPQPRRPVLRPPDPVPVLARGQVRTARVRRGLEVRL